MAQYQDSSDKKIKLTPEQDSPFNSSKEKNNLTPIFEAIVSSFIFSICCMLIHLSPSRVFDETLLSAICSVILLSFGMGIYWLINLSCKEMIQDVTSSLPLVSIQPNAQRLLVFISIVFKGMLLFAVGIL